MSKPEIIDRFSMRALFKSESRCVSSLFTSKWPNTTCDLPQVVNETIAEPANLSMRPWFNSDFILHFIDWNTVRSKRSAAAGSVLPNALGAELFLVVDQTTLAPTALELNGGPAFSIEHYTKFIEIIESRIRNIICKIAQRMSDLLQDGVAESVSVRKAAFARILVVGSDITFLYCPNTTAPVALGKCLNLVRSNDCEIDCYLKGDQVVCWDGWIRTQIETTEQVLVSMPVD